MLNRTLAQFFRNDREQVFKVRDDEDIETVAEGIRHVAADAFELPLSVHPNFVIA